MRRAGSLLQLLVGPAILIGLWAAVHAGGLGGRLLPGPGATLAAMARGIAGGPLLVDIEWTLWRVLAAFVVAVVLGLMIGADERI